MENLIAAMESMPTGVYTVGMAMMFAYWVFVLIGVLDVDLIPINGPDVDVDADLDADIHVGFFGGMIHSMGVGTVPLTVILSSLVSTGWLIGLGSEMFIWPTVQDWMPALAFGAVQFLVMFLAGIKLTAVCMKPLKNKLTVEQIHGQAHLIGKTIIITSGSVSEKVGTASLQEPGLDLTLNVRDEAKNKLKRGDHAVIIDYNNETNMYKIRPISLDSEGV